MGIKAYLTEKLFGAAIEQAVLQRLPAASSGAGDATPWRRLSGNSNRELPVAAWQRQVEVCYWLWKTNPLGNWIIETLTTFVTGKGFTYTVKIDAVKEILDSFWFDPINRMDINLEEMTRELFLYGVQCWPVFVAEQTGKVRLGMIDPALIVEIYTDPQNAKLQIGVKIQTMHSAETRQMKIILAGEAETVMSNDARIMRDGFTDGECFLFSINRVSNDPYGTSDLFVIADWLDEYEEFIYNYADKARKQNAYIWDVEVNGGDEATCEKIAQAYSRQEDGAIRVHNEKVKWATVAPNLQAMEIKESAGVFRNHILGNKSIPEHWYGGGGDVNRNTASESNDPIMALVDSRKNKIKFIIETIFTYCIRKALDAGYLVMPEDEAFNFAVQLPETTNKDLTKISTAVRDIITSMVAAASQGWLDAGNAAKLFALVIALIGFEIDTDNLQENEPGTEDYQTGKNAPESPDGNSTATDHATGPGSGL
ncbi:MAG TPA: hypothetical protein HPP94_08670 [Desulfuromonadales bacterium]|nr:hypothetical protein [Desulfuromonadales bacterium]